MARRCNSCNRLRHQSSYSVSEWSAGEGNSRCALCVNIYGPPFLATPPPPEASGFNHASGGSVSYRQLGHPFASGQYRWLAKGNYTSGVHKGKACVVKWFKSTATAFENDYFAIDRAAVEQAITILSEFNKLAIVDKPIKVNVPAAWKFDDAITDWGGRKALCEPFIQNYEKYNSNTGWRNNYWGDGTNLWSSVMQALSRKYTPAPFRLHVSLTYCTRFQLPHHREGVRSLRPPGRRLRGSSRPIQPRDPLSGPRVWCYGFRPEWYLQLLPPAYVQRILPRRLDAARRNGAALCPGPSYDHGSPLKGHGCILGLQARPVDEGNPSVERI